MTDTMAHIHMTAHRRAGKTASPAKGRITKRDAGISCWEERVDEKDFKRRVFDKVIRFMRNRGWEITVDSAIHERHKSLWSTHKEGVKGELHCKIETTGRSFTVEMWSEYNSDNRNGGRYCFDRRKRMPYLIGKACDLELLYLKSYMCRITDHPFDDRDYDKESADQKLQRLLTSSGHYRPELGHAPFSMESNRRSADGFLLEHGQTVYFRDRKGYMMRGQAFYNLNNMWWVKLNRFNLTNLANFELYTSPPPPPGRRKCVSERTRRSRVEELMTAAIAKMDFTRAEVLKNVLFRDEKLFRIWAKDHSAWYRPVSCGYTNELVAAGLYTEREARNIVKNCSDLRMEPV